VCDTFIADFSGEGSGYKIFGKNSDREPNEAQAIVRFPRTTNTNVEVRTTFITIPQVQETYEVILSKPFQMWGAEMGVNEYGVAIGNEAVFTNIAFKKDNSGLTGMDMLRLALERSTTAKNALECIANLLEQYGQDACGGYTDHNFYYHNSFIIADAVSQYILETAGRHWVARSVQGYAAISNGLSIGEDYDLCSESVRKMGKPHFSNKFRDKLMSHFARCDYRRLHSISQAGKVQRDAVKGAFKILQSHGDADPFQPENADMKALCIHAKGLLTPHQTTGSIVVQWREDGPATVWLTGTSAPCLSLFTPFYFGGKTLVGKGIHLPSARTDDSLWWQGERLHRLILKDYRGLSVKVREAMSTLQAGFVAKDAALHAVGAGNDELDEFSSAALAEHYTLIQQLIQEVAPLAPLNYPGYWLYRRFRNKIDQQALPK
jgi:dipeptidase